MEEKMNESKFNFVQDKWYIILHEGTGVIAMYKYQDLAHNYVFDHPAGTKIFSKEYLESSSIHEVQIQSQALREKLVIEKINHQLMSSSKSEIYAIEKRFTKPKR